MSNQPERLNPQEILIKDTRFLGNAIMNHYRNSENIDPSYVLSIATAVRDRMWALFAGSDHEYVMCQTPYFFCWTDGEPKASLHEGGNDSDATVTLKNPNVEARTFKVEEYAYTGLWYTCEGEIQIDENEPEENRKLFVPVADSDLIRFGNSYN